MILSEPKQNSGAHYYGRDEQGNINLTASGLRDARKVGAVPSATTIESVVEKTGLNIWKLNNAVRHAIHTDRVPTEDDDTLTKRILTEAGRLNVDAMSYGTMMHDQAERILNGQTYDNEDPFVAKVADWISDNVTKVHWTERGLMHPTFLFAGRADAMVDVKGIDGPVILDWKTQKFSYSSGKVKPHFYDSYPRQLAAYADCVGAGEVRPRIMSVAINTVAPTVPVERLWSEAEQAHALRAFLLVAELWCILKKYDPRLYERN